MAESRTLRVLALLDGRYAEFAGPLLRHLSACSGLELTVAGGSARLDACDVVLCGQERAPEGEEARRLAGFVAAGGGAVALHSTLGAWAREPQLAGLAGWAPGEPAPAAELLVHPTSLPFAERLDGELRIRDRLLLSDPPPPDATVLLTVPWHFSERPLAFARAHGAGRVVHLGLGGEPSAWRHPDFGGLVLRALRQAGAVDPAPPLGVGLYGYGAIGREHAASAAEVAGFELRGVCDRSPERRAAAAAAFGVEAHAEAARMLADPGIDLVVVGVPPVAHEGAVLEALAAGKHVVCEKPFALHVSECDAMIDAARDAGRALTVYQSRRWDPDYVALRGAVTAGAIGRLFYMESFIGGFSHPCSYWHSHEPVSGGTIFDWGSHYFDWMLQLFPGRVRSVAASAQKRVWHDVTNADQVRVDITFDDGAQATFLQSDIAAALKPKWYLLGTEGSITGEWRQESIKSRAWTGDLVEERLAPAEAPAIVTVHRPDGSGGAHREELSAPPRRRNGFYRALGDHLFLGEPSAVTPLESRRNVLVMEAAARSIAAGTAVEVTE